MARFVTVVGVAALIVLPAWASEPASESVDLKAERTRLKEHYVGKIVVAKIDLPRTDGGYLFINSGELDSVGLQKSIQGTSSLGVESGGIGVPKGSSVIIGDVKVGSNYVTFLFGTSTGAEWSKALSTMATGSADSPHAGTKSEPVSGTGIVVCFDAEMGKRGVKARSARPLEPEDLDIAVLNEALSLAIDTRTLTAITDVPQEHREAIEDGRVVVGMDKRSVFLAIGEPKDKQTDLSGDDVIEKWMYEHDDMTTTLVIMSNGVVTEVRHF